MLYIIKNLLKIIILLIIIFLVIQIIYSSVNPWSIDYTKYKLLTFVPQNYLLKTYIYNEKYENNITFPIIIKPTICSGVNRSVKLLNNINDLINYKKNMNKNEIYILQEYFNSKYEVGLLYEKLPHNKNGKIISIVSKKKSNNNNWKALKCKNIASNDGVQCEDYTYMITEELTKSINDISNKIPDFYAGRYDIGFDNIDDFKKGKNFKIYELNGVMGFDLRTNRINNFEIFNSEKNYYMIRWYFIRFYIGLLNILYSKANLLNRISNLQNMYKYHNLCNDWEFLFQPSPA